MVSPFVQRITGISARALKEPKISLLKTRKKLVHKTENLLISRTRKQNRSQETVTDKEIRVIGLKRSGNHGIMGWIEKQSTGVVVHLNFVK